jgi:hypothetical protein
MKKENPFNWTEKYDKAFDILKKACIELLVLVVF